MRSGWDFVSGESGGVQQLLLVAFTLVIASGLCIVFCEVAVFAAGFPPQHPPELGTAVSVVRFVGVAWPLIVGFDDSELIAGAAIGGGNAGYIIGWGPYEPSNEGIAMGP